ncbi:MAG: glycosyl hydrolase 115 family protein, partial [Candidatus Saccharimonadales bacterium]
MPDIKDKWEHFFIRVLDNASHPSKNILLIVGSDARGAAYGVFTLSRIIGVSPWKWWADVTPPKKEKLIIDKRIDIEEGPSVKYRGIFLNDEDWGLRPWASKTFEPELGNIGPKTYARVFELLLRLKANTIWPAMHPGTTPFFEVKGNESVARKYDIVIGTAHNEPMTRDNAVEWHRRPMGKFNYVTNRDSVYNYWKKRVVRVAKDDIIYTVGMRGTGDSRMEGVTTLSQETAVLAKVFKDQRELLRKYVNPDVQKVPQVFIPYKEVLPVYDHGLQVPDDV